MLKISKKPNFPITLFVAASLATFVLFSFLFFLAKVNLTGNTIAQKPNSKEKYYLNENYSEGDLLITKVPNLKDMLVGPIISNLDPSLGEEGAAITIVEFSDFECNFCQKHEQIIKQIMEEYPDKIKLIWKDYPENNQNLPSFQAAIAGRCAQEQNQFWAYHDLLYKNSNNLNQETYLSLAKKLNLNLIKFNNCLAGNEAKKLIRNNIEEANALDIKGIPFIYINNQEVMGQISLEELKQIIEIELGKTKN